MITFEIPGKPFAKQRPRATRQGRVYTPKETVSFERTVGQIAAHHFPKPFDGPVSVFIWATFQPPKSWSRKKTGDHIGRARGCAAAGATAGASCILALPDDVWVAAFATLGVCPAALNAARVSHRWRGNVRLLLRSRGGRHTLFMLGQCLRWGLDGRIIDKTRGRQLVELAASGSRDETPAVAICILNGWSEWACDDNQTRCERAYAMLLRIESSSSSTLSQWAVYHLAVLTRLSGRHRQALARYEAAAAAGLSVAIHDLAVMHLEGSAGCRVQQDTSAALRGFQRGAELGDCAARCQLARMLYHGQGGATVNRRHALALWKQSAEQRFAWALYQVALCHYFGEAGLEVDRRAAFEWMKRAAAQELPAAICDLGSYYHRGVGIRRSEAAALSLFQQAADQGFPRAQYNIGVYFERGLGGLTANVGTARDYYRRASEEGHEGAQHALLRLDA